MSVAALTLYDMIKAVDPAARIDDVRVLRKDGGRHGTWAALMSGRSARVIIASTRASTGVYRDQCGPIISEWLAQQGLSSTPPVVVEDGDSVGKALRDAVAEEVDVVITSGGTGISPSDDTPAQTTAVLDYAIPGLADAIRRSGLPKVPTSMLSRGRVRGGRADSGGQPAGFAGRGTRRAQGARRRAGPRAGSNCRRRPLSR